MGCNENKGSVKANSLAELVADFLKEEKCCPRDEIKDFRCLKIKDAIKKAVRAKSENGQLYKHQWNLFNHPEVPQKAEAILMQCVGEIEKCKNFDVLHELIKSKLQMPFAGELYWYDTAFRIGISLNIYPEKVYLHRGTKLGAKALNIYKGKEVLEMSELPEELQKLKPYCFVETF